MLLEEAMAIFRPTRLGLRLEIKPDVRRRLCAATIARIFALGVDSMTTDRSDIAVRLRDWMAV